MNMHFYFEISYMFIVCLALFSEDLVLSLSFFILDMFFSD